LSYGHSTQLQQCEFIESDVSLLKEWLFKISNEKRAYIKGASKALLYAQENEELFLNHDNRCIGN